MDDFNTNFVILEKFKFFRVIIFYVEKQYILKIGSKGEIFPPKEVRVSLGLISNQPILVKVYNNRMIIQKLESVEEILNKPSSTKISYHALKQLKSEFD